MAKEAKNYRTLDMYVRLCEGKMVNKSEEARKFGVDERSIQRDIDDIRAFLDERSMSGDGRTIEFKMCSPKSVESKASKALSKADIAVIITFTRKGLNKVNTNNIFGKGEVFILNTYTVTLSQIIGL